MDVLTAILACSLHLDDQLVRAIVEIQSEGHEFFVGDLTELASDDSTRTLEAARAAVARLRVKGHRPAFGLMGVPPEWARAYDHDPERLWDACVNVSIGTAKLSEFDYECRHQKKDVVRRRGD